MAGVVLVYGWIDNKNWTNQIRRFSIDHSACLLIGTKNSLAFRSQVLAYSLDFREMRFEENVINVSRKQPRNISPRSTSTRYFQIPNIPSLASCSLSSTFHLSTPVLPVSLWIFLYWYLISEHITRNMLISIHLIRNLCNFFFLAQEYSTSGSLKSER